MSLLKNTSLGSDRCCDLSQIQRYFKGKTVFVTGGTGFLGKLVIEKLLRACDIEKIYVLIRKKKDKEPSERIQELVDIPAFEPLKKQNPDFAHKILLCIGDCLKPKLGLCQEDIDLLKNQVECVINCAATVRFDASLRKATYINVRAVNDVLELAKSMWKLTSFIHVSTVYSHCPRNDIGEKVYEPPMKGQKLMDLVEALDDDVLDAITPIIIKEWPNTYTFTKAVAEEIVKTEGQGLPVSVFKPSIFIASSKEPIPGWIDNVYGPTGIMIAVGLGVVRTVHCNKRKRIDLVPVDYVVNAILATAWNVGRSDNTVSIHNQRDLTVYNYVSGCQNPLYWSDFLRLVWQLGFQIPLSKLVWYYVIFFNSSSYVNLLCEFFLHTVPAYIIDLLLLCIGKEPMLVDGYKKITKLSRATSFFTTRHWNFEDTNVQSLWNKLDARDRELFEFDIKLLDWNVLFRSYVLGCRVYILKDSLDTLPKAKRKLQIFRVVHYALIVFLSSLLYILLKFMFNNIF